MGLHHADFLGLPPIAFSMARAALERMACSFPGYISPPESGDSINQNGMDGQRSILARQDFEGNPLPAASGVFPMSATIRSARAPV